MGFMTAAIVGSSVVGAAASASAGRSQARAAERGADAQVQAAQIAADSQERIADRQIGLSREVYDDQTQRFAPFLDSGTNALAAYQYEMGLGPRPTIGATPLNVQEIPGSEPPLVQQIMRQQAVQAPQLGEDGRERLSFLPGQRAQAGPEFRVGDQTFGSEQEARDFAAGQARQQQFRVGDQNFSTRADADRFARANATGGTEWGGLSMTPGAQFAMREGRDTMEAGAAARGGLNSGATLAGLERLRFGMAQQDRENQLNRLGGMVDMGQGAAGMQASAGNAFAGQANNALGNLGAVQANTAMMSGQAQAQGLMGAANAQGAGMMGAANALSGGVNNILGWQAYQQMANQPSANAFAAGGLGSGRLY